MEVFTAASGTPRGVYVTGDSVKLNNLTVTSPRGAGIRVENGSNHQLETVWVDGGLVNGIEVHDALTTKLMDCTVRRSGAYGISLTASSAAATQNTRISRGVFHDNAIAHILHGADVDLTIITFDSYLATQTNQVVDLGTNLRYEFQDLNATHDAGLSLSQFLALKDA